jgi:hypothetical protein
MRGLQARFEGGDELTGLGFAAEGHAMAGETYLPAGTCGFVQWLNADVHE